MNLHLENLKSHLIMLIHTGNLLKCQPVFSVSLKIVIDHSVVQVHHPQNIPFISMCSSVLGIIQQHDSCMSCLPVNLFCGHPVVVVVVVAAAAAAEWWWW
jgi:hypothetical protein